MEHQWYGFFYGGDCYLVLYTYEIHGKPHYILYIWQVGLMQALNLGSPCFPWAPGRGARGSRDPLLPSHPCRAATPRWTS